MAGTSPTMTADASAAMFINKRPAPKGRSLHFRASHGRARSSLHYGLRARFSVPFADLLVRKRDTMTGSHDHPNAGHSHAGHDHSDAERWKHDGVRVIPGNQLNPNVR